MNISKHLSTLLVLHDCVIVPNFGAFLGNEVPSGFDARTRLFYPPTKEVIFNEKISRNDGLFVNHLAEAEGISYEEAFDVLNRFREQSLETIYSGKVVDMEQIGLLKLNQYGKIDFISYNRLKSVDAYGLVEFSFPKLSERHVAQTRPLYTENPAVVAITRNRSAIRIAASIALLLSLSLFPIRNHYQTVNTSNLNPISAMAPKALLESLAVSADDTSQAELVTPVEEVIETQLPYILVAGTFSHQQNASNLVDELKLKGHKSELILLNDGRYRVAIDAFNDKDEAILAMTQYREDNAGSMAWVTTR